MNDVAIVIVSWNTKALLRNCINSVVEQTKKYSYEIWVVDNDSPDKSAQMVAEEFPNVKLIANKDNRGFAPANNQALREAKAKNYLLLNPDTVVIDGAIDKMLDYMYEHNPGIVTCKLLNDDLTLQKSVNNFFSIWRSLFENRFFADVFSKLNIKGNLFASYWDHAEDREIDWAFGAVLLYSDEVHQKVGDLDDKYFIYAEEMDFYIRVKRAGYKAIFLSDVKIIHYGKSSSRQKRGEMFIQNYKSFYLFLKKHYPPYVYPFYRFRTLVYMNIWMAYFGTKIIFKGILGKNNSEDKATLEVYWKTFLWHFTSASKITA